MEEIKLYSEKIYNGCEKVVMQCYVQKPSKELTMPPRPVVLIFPGGGYSYTSDREAEPIANAYLAAGYTAFVLRYSVGEHAVDSQPLLDAALAIATIRSNAEKYHIDPDKIAVCGFSAGGHLAAFISTQWHSEIIKEKLNIENIQAKPNAMILCYPVISGITSPNVHSFLNLTGQNSNEENSIKYSIENHVDERTCPAFVWHTSDDTTVNVKNSMVLGQALSDHNILFEMHIFPTGAHGLSACTRETAANGNDIYISPYIGRWIGWSVKWLNNLFFKDNPFHD
ncbi:alpha/beta hydrolase [Eubacteriales bacterium OttesenSCG-928-G02]|nr:alpha/beta hydrolase [Eubacteriales bacterium OttesenSCG-928-G02]